MKFKTRLIIAFLTVIMIPVALTSLFVLLLGRYQISAIEKTYGLTGTTVEVLANPIQVLEKLTIEPYEELEETARQDAGKLEDATYLNELNDTLLEKKSFLIVRREDTVTYMGREIEKSGDVIRRLPPRGSTVTDPDGGIYLGGGLQVLLKQVDFRYGDGTQGSAFIVTDVGDMIPEIREFAFDVLLVIALVLVFTATVLVLWIYQSVVQPLSRMQKAAQYIKMRRRLKESAEEKLTFDKESKELISNISHDLKTPVTTIKGYAEGILDGVADTPQKVEKYVRTIYNKAGEMDTLINELTFYSKIDTNRIPYNFDTIFVNRYFDDCAEDLSLELEQRGVEFGYFNYVEEDVRIIADAEQIRRVVHNIVNNSLKYMDKATGKINLRVKDVGDFVQVEVEDNGCGIAARDLPNIFERFYRTDASRNSSKGGSGIGLSVVKKIIEDHGGKIWATSREGTGTTLYFVLRKYQEVPVYE